MSVVIFLSCNHEGCSTAQPTNAETVAAARIELRLRGWTTTSRYDQRRGHMVTDDQCPPHAVQQQGGHAAAELDRRVPSDKCTGTVACKDAKGFPLPKSDPRRAIFDWCGHDNLGHRMANILLRDGYRDVTAVVGAKEGDLLDLRGWGEMCMKRWELFKEMDRAA